MIRKPPDLPSSYLPISLLPVMGKLLEKLILKTLLLHIADTIPNHLFGFRSLQSTIKQTLYPRPVNWSRSALGSFSTTNRSSIESGTRDSCSKSRGSSHPHTTFSWNHSCPTASSKCATNHLSRLTSLKTEEFPREVSYLLFSTSYKPLMSQHILPPSFLQSLMTLHPTHTPP